MTDTMNTTSIPTIELPAPVASERRTVMVGELARAEAATAAAHARIAELEAEATRLRTEQITDGADPRLLDFWEKAGRIADHANFCEEYDRLADAMNGTPREREWDVVTDVQITLTVTRTVTATTESGAVEYAEEVLDREDVIEALRSRGWDDIEFNGSEAERS